MQRVWLDHETAAVPGRPARVAQIFKLSLPWHGNNSRSPSRFGNGVWAIASVNLKIPDSIQRDSETVAHRLTTLCSSGLRAQDGERKRRQAERCVTGVDGR